MDRRQQQRRRWRPNVDIADDADERRSPDTLSLASSGRATTIRVPYKPTGAGEAKPAREARVAEAERPAKTTEATPEAKPHFNYRTIIANVQPVPIVPRQQVIDAYNVRVIQHKSPFLDQIQPITSMSDLSSSIARLEQLSSDLSSLASAKPQAAGADNQPAAADNNNEANFDLGQFMKQKQPVFVGPVAVEAEEAESQSANIDEDNVSLVSSCSLRSSRTYHVRSVQDGSPSNGARLDQNEQDHDDNDEDDELNDASDFPVESIEFVNKQSANNPDDGDSKRPKAWLFDLRDNSATDIVAPPRPKEPEAPKVDAKTEELARSRGGRSYYLELVEKGPRAKVNENLYTRWRSHNALDTQATTRKPVSCSDSSKGSSKLRAPQGKGPKTSELPPPALASKQTSLAANKTDGQQSASAKESLAASRRQLLFSGPPPRLGDRSKSVSCLASSTRPTKYSIYGGFRRPDADKKPVPRLSYSRAIGPKSARQSAESQQKPKTPSRWLKMK